MKKITISRKKYKTFFIEHTWESQVYLMATNQDLLTSGRQWKCLYPGGNWRGKTSRYFVSLNSCINKHYSLEKHFYLKKKKRVFHTLFFKCPKASPKLPPTGILKCLSRETNTGCTHQICNASPYLGCKPLKGILFNSVSLASDKSTWIMDI